MIRVNVEGNPEEVAAFFKEMGSTRATEFHHEFMAPPNLDAETSDLRIGHDPVEKFLPEADKGTMSLDVHIEESLEKKTERKPEGTEYKSLSNTFKEATPKKPGRPKKEKAVKPEVVTPDPEFSDLPGVAENATTEVIEEPEKPSVTREMVQAALKEYGIWLQQTGEVKQGQIRPYLYALTKKFGNGVTGTPDLGEQYFGAVMQAAVSRIPPFELEEFV